MTDLAAQLQSRAQRLGFSNLGWTAIDTDHTWHAQFMQWLAEARHGDMTWMARTPERRSDPRQILPDAHTLISVTLNYFTPYAQSHDPARGRISRYAWGDDYHEVMLPRLKALLTDLRALDPNAEGIAYVDTGPVLEKPWAARAGLGWQGKHTNLIDRRRGSWFFLGEIITTLAIPPALRTEPSRGDRHVGLRPTRDTPAAGQPPASHCGTCTRCIEVCPTRAITAPYQLDARRCISYLTIEHKGSIPEALRPLLGNHIYGCDLCQDVCPWNRFATATPEPAFQPRADNLQPVLIELMAMTDAEFRTRFRHSPIKRIKRARFLRNVAVALGNSRNPAAIPALQRACEDPEPLIREHAAWALAQCRSS